jgi:hypothetical protein
MNITDARNPVWVNQSRTIIDLEVMFDHLDDYVPFTVQVCEEELLTEYFNKAVAGDFGEISDIAEEREASNVRLKRDMLLGSTDWTQNFDVSEATREKWTAYRQALRDITQQSGFPFDVTFPTPPN